MVIEKVHGLQATGISLNERFTMLASAAPDRVIARQRQRRASTGSFYNQNLNLKNRNLIEQIARRLEQQAKRRALRQRLGVPPGALRRFGSESSLPGLRRSNSFGNLSQARSIKSRVSWNLRRSASFNNLSGFGWRGRPLRGFRRRGGGQRALWGRFRGGRQGQGRVTRMPQNFTRRGGGAARARGARGGRVPGTRGGGVPSTRGGGTPGTRGGGAPGTRGGGVSGTRGGLIAAQPARGQTARGRGRGGIIRNQQPNPVPTKEELDAQLDQYMAGTKSALDKELDAYMKNAMELE